MVRAVDKESGKESASLSVPIAILHLCYRPPSCRDKTCLTSTVNRVKNQRLRAMGAMMNLDSDYDPWAAVEAEHGGLQSTAPDNEIADASSDAAPVDEDPLGNVVKLNASTPEPKVWKPHAVISDYVPTVEQLEDREARAWKSGPRVRGVPILCSTTNLVYGPPESGKSWFCKYVAIEQMAKGNNVIYCDFEFGDEGTIDRLYALGMTYEQQMEHLTVVTQFADLNYRDVSKVEQMKELVIDLVRKRNPTVVIFDTVPALFTSLVDGNTNENDNTAMQTLFNSFYDICQRTKVPVIATGHTGKAGETMRGASASHGAARMSYLVRKVRDFGRGMDGVIELVKKKDSNSLVNFPVFVDLKSDGLPKRQVQLPSGVAKIDAMDIEVRSLEGGYVDADTLQAVELATFVLKQGGPVTVTTIKNSSGVKGITGIIKNKETNPEAYDKIFEKLDSIEGVVGGLDGPWEFADASASIEDKIEAIAVAFGVDLRTVQTKWNGDFD